MKIYNQKTGQSRALASKSDKPKQNEKLCIHVQFLCTDYAGQYSGKFVKVNVIQESDEGYFAGIAPQDLIGNSKRNQESQLRFHMALRTILRFNVYQDAKINIV